MQSEMQALKLQFQMLFHKVRMQFNHAEYESELMQINHAGVNTGMGMAVTSPTD